jgi:hypothetical protein
MEEKNIFDILLDKDNNDVLTLYGDDNEPHEFEQIAVIPYEESIYAILRPMVLFEGMEDDEALVFEITEEELIELVTDDDIIDAVFDIYNEMIEEEDGGY